MRLTRFKRGILCAVLLAGAVVLLLPCQTLAWEAEETVGQPGMLLAAVSGNGSMTGESVMGDACADAVRIAAGTDFALVNGGELIANLEPKQLTYDEICAALEQPEAEIAVATVTLSELCQLLEAGVCQITLDAETEAIDQAASEFEGFPQVSGFRFTYDASAHAGERVMHVYRDGEELTEDGTERFNIAAPAELLDGALGYPVMEYESTDITLASALADYIAAGTGDAYTGEGRITVVGCTDYNIVNHFPLALCAAAAILIWLGARVWKFKYFDRNTR